MDDILREKIIPLTVWRLNVIRYKGKKRFKGLITEDGEVLYIDLILNAFIPNPPKDKEPYIKVYGEKLLELIVQKKLKNSTLNVFLWFMGKTGKDLWNNDWINVDYNEIANELGITYRSVKNAIKELKELKIIVQWRPRQTVFRLNPEYCFKGGVIAKEKMKEEINGSDAETIEEFTEKAVKALNK
jgi:hypothetical protein